MAFLGMRGTGDWITNQRPESWRQALLYRYPNGDMPLVGISSMMPSDKITDPKHHYFIKALPDQRADVTGVFTDAALGSAYVSSSAVGDILYAKMSAAHVVEFRVGHLAMLRNEGDHNYDLQGEVVGVLEAGASSYVAVKIHKASSPSYEPTTANIDHLLIIGNVNAEGATMPDALHYDPFERYTLTQIWRTPLSITRTARETKLRTGDSYKEEKRQALELHGIEMEKSGIWADLYETTGANRKPKRVTRGIVPGIKAWSGTENDGVNVYGFSSDADFSGQTWLEGGEDFLDEKLERIFRFGEREKLGLSGSAAVLGLNKLARAGAIMNITPETVSYGIKVGTWVTPFGTIYLKTHPLLSYQPTNLHDIVICEPSKLRFVYITDTKFKADNSQNESTGASKDGTEEEYITEGAWEIGDIAGWGYLSGIGNDNAV